jgi:MFS family permease
MKRTDAKLPAVVWALGLASFLTDLSSEMIYPLLPVFLAGTLGAGAVSLGIIEGVAETTASVLKIFSGRWADRVTRRKPIILAGYTLSSLARPLIGLAWAWPVVMALRFTDRVGKGVRSSPRDALIADAVPAARRGEAFGIQRSLDHAGAVCGPLVAAGLMTFLGLSLRNVFLLAAVPAVACIVALAVGIHETPRIVTPKAAGEKGESAVSPEYRRFLIALALFALGNSTDAFLLLRLSNAGVAAALIAVLWSAHHVVKMTAAYYGGSLSDRIGRKTMVMAGWGVYALAYLGFALVDHAAPLIVIFLAYGLYQGFCEPSEKAWAVDLVPAGVRGTALGWYNGVTGLAALPASILFGLVWQSFGAPAAFMLGCVLAGLAAALLLRVPATASGSADPK